MGIQMVFNIAGIIFLYSSIAYFAYREGIFGLGEQIKTIILLLLAIIFFYLGDTMIRRGR